DRAQFARCDLGEKLGVYRLQVDERGNADVVAIGLEDGRRDLLSVWRWLRLEESGLCVAHALKIGNHDRVGRRGAERATIQGHDAAAIGAEVDVASVQRPTR